MFIVLNQQECNNLAKRTLLGIWYFRLLHAGLNDTERIADRFSELLIIFPILNHQVSKEHMYVC